ncbi:hypothetical protein SprV_0301194400 [Sparganum proliferum]
MPIHESRISRSPDTPSTSSTLIMPSSAHASPPSAPTATSSITLSTSCTLTMLSPTHTPSPSWPTTTSSTISITKADTDIADFSCPHCPHTFTSRIGLAGHLRIHHRETGEPVLGAPTYTRRMGLFGHMRIHESGIDCSPDTPSTPTMSTSAHVPQINAHAATNSTILSASCTPTMLSPDHTPSSTTTTEADSDTIEIDG